LSSQPESIGELKSLTKLNLSENPIPANEIEKLRAALPNCKIDF
jgi:Leucine-rich repeat (LRR) protein